MHKKEELEDNASTATCPGRYPKNPPGQGRAWAGTLPRHGTASPAARHVGRAFSPKEGKMCCAATRLGVYDGVQDNKPSLL